MEVAPEGSLYSSAILMKLLYRSICMGLLSVKINFFVNDQPFWLSSKSIILTNSPVHLASNEGFLVQA